jgi:acetoin:2,6-dichlorophenolindophenol oxidoreductase subunit alpha
MLADDSWLLYRSMFQIRYVEESFLRLYDRGLIFGTVHTCIGQEVCAVAVTQALDAGRDVVWSSHRGHGHYLAFTGDLKGLVSEVLGKASGVCGGIGGSQHLHRDNFYSNGILGGTVPCAVGCAYAEKAKGSGGVVAVFFGDGALAEGAVYEGFNIASLWELPVLFVLEDNGYAQSTPKKYEHAGDLATRGESFGIETTRSRADDVLAVRRAARLIVDEIRRTSRPHLLALETYRLAPHSKGDDTRDPQEIAALRKRDPIGLHREQLRACDAERLDQLEREVADQIDACVAAAIEEDSPEPGQFLAYGDPR